MESKASNISFKDFNDYASDILLHLVNNEVFPLNINIKINILI